MNDEPTNPARSDSEPQLPVLRVADLLTRVRAELQIGEAGNALLDAFLKNKSPQTIDAYQQDLRAFRSWMVKRGTLPGEVTINQCGDLLVRLAAGEANLLVLHWLQAMRDSGLAGSTLKRRVATLKSLVKLAGSMGLCNWRLEVRAPPARNSRDVRGPSRDNYLRILQEIRRRDDQIGLRDEALVRLLRDRVLRRAEALSINIEDIDRVQRRVLVQRKGYIDLTPITLAPETMEAVLRWIASWGKDKGPLLVALDNTSRGQRLSGKGAWKIISRYGEKLGLKIWPHALRHSGTTEALDKGYSIRDVMQLTGHETPAMVMRYDDARRDVGGSISADLAEGTSPDSIDETDGTAYAE